MSDIKELGAVEFSDIGLETNKATKEKGYNHALTIEDIDNENTERRLGAQNAEPNWMVYVVIGFACIGAAMFGIDQGNFGNLQGFEEFQTKWCLGRYGDNTTCYGTNAADNSDWQNNFVLWGAVLITFGSAFGALLVGPLIAPNFGRRACIAVGALICVLGCVIAAFLNFDNVGAFFFGRFVTGFGVGVACYALPMYSAELSPAKIRGATGSLFQLNVVLGSFIATIITLYMKNWQIALCLPAFPAAILSVGIWLCPESPRYLTKKKGTEEAIKALQRVRKGDVLDEAYEIDNTLQTEASLPEMTYTTLFKNRSLLKRLGIACGMQACQQLTGVNVFLSYANTIFTQIGINDPLTFNVIFNGVMVCGILVGLFFLDKQYFFCGRKNQLLIGSVLMAPTLLIGGIFLLEDWSGTVTMIMVLLYAFGFQIGWGPISWVYTSEIFEMHSREKAMSIAVFVQYFSNGIIVLITPHMTTWNIGGSLLIFAGLNFIGFFFTLFCVVETKGVPLEKIPALFDKKSIDEESKTEL